MKKKMILLLVLTLVASMFLAACAPKATDVEPGDNDQAATSNEPSGTLIVGFQEASGNFNPAYYSSSYDGYVVDMVFETLIVRNFEGEYEPSVADSWEFSEDGKSITFKLKEDIVFSDGEPLTADDVVFTYKAIADPSYTGRNGTLVKDLKGYNEYFNKETEEFEGVVAIDEHTVQFNFVEALRTNLANTTMYIMPEHYYGAEFAYNNTAPVEAITSAPIGSGPYKLTQFIESELVHLERNDKYSTTEGYMIKEIIGKFVDQTTELVELETGAVDMLPSQIKPENIAKAREMEYGINDYQRSGYGYIKTNNEWGPTTDPKVRQALYYSFNIKEFVNSYYKDEATGQVLASVQYHPFSQISWAIDEDLQKELIAYDFDLEKAKALLDEAGWKLNANGVREKDGQELELRITAMPDHDILATLIPMWERDWGQGLGVKLNIAYLEFNTILDYVIYNSDANVDKWSLFFLATSITTPDPHTMYSSFHSTFVGSGENNTSRYSNPEVDKLFDDAKAIMDIEEAKPYYQKIAKILNEEAVMMPVYANTYFDLYNPKLVDFKTNSLYDWVAALKDARIEE